MLQGATKIINSAFQNSFIKKLCLYLHDCVREEVQSSTFRNLKQDKDNKWMFLNDEEKLFTNFPENLSLDGSNSLLTELMIQAEMGAKDKYLIYGHLFLVGKNGKSRKYSDFLTPLLYVPCKLEREGMNINCILQDEVLSLNTGALTSLMKKTDDEDEIEHLIDGLLDVVPDLPLTEEKVQIFLTTLKSIIPDVEVAITQEEESSENNIDNSDADSFYNEHKKIDFNSLEDIDDEEVKPKFKVEKVAVTRQSAVILTKRPTITAGVLHELMQISEKPSGVYRETSLAPINEEFLQSKGKMLNQEPKNKQLKDFYPVTPLSLSDSQEEVIRKIENNPMLAVYGPPGTGKSQTIVNLVAHMIANGKTVLVASRMDKAVDVVAERLNELGAPYLALRAGRMNYQRQLSFDLQDLISNKVDLDHGYENVVLLDVEDMHKLLDKIKDLETRCEKIITLEKEWAQAHQERENKRKELQDSYYIKRKLKKDEIDLLRGLNKKLEKNLEKSNIFVNISNFLNTFKIKQTLKLKDFVADYDTLTRLSEEIEMSQLEYQERFIEANIQKIGNIHQMFNQIKMLKKRQKKLAIDILKNKRREALKGLLRDQIKRQRIIVHAKSLTERKKNLQSRILEDQDFKPLLEAFPCWCLTTYQVSGSLPLKPGLFDVAIIDEASQCDIASCFPILYRAKKVVIVGDDKQLPHLSFLEKAKEQSFLSKYQIPDKYQLMWRFRINSMFDLANYYSTNPTLLDEHFRCQEPIIKFSNEEFYGGRLRVMTKDNGAKDTLEFHYVPDGKCDSDATKNRPETEAIIKRLHEIILEDDMKKNDEPVSIGIISPFRGQVEMIKKAVLQVFSEATILKHKIEIGTAHTFQGDERDIIMLSWAIADNSYSQSLMFLQKPNLFNVAITRARKKLICFLSKNPKDLPQGLLRSYIESFETYETRNKSDAPVYDENVFKNDFEKVVYDALKAEGLEIQAGKNLSGVSVDLFVKDSEGSQLLVEIDGVEDKEKTYISATKKQAILERSGYRVERISAREWRYSPDACINRVKNILAEENCV